MINTIEELLCEIDGYFLAPAKLNRVLQFKAQRRQKEDWFHDELRDLFTSLQVQGRMSPGWDHEIRLSEALSRSEEKKGQEDIDFMLVINQQPMYLEVKTAYLGKQGGNSFSHASYLNIRGPIGKDVRKLKDLARIARCFCILFVYPSPASPEVQEQVQKKPKGWMSWEDCMTNFCRSMQAENIDVQDITPSDSMRSEHLYIARLEVLSAAHERSGG